MAKSSLPVRISPLMALALSRTPNCESFEVTPHPTMVSAAINQKVFDLYANNSNSSPNIFFPICFTNIFVNIISTLTSFRKILKFQSPPVEIEYC